MTHIPHKFCPYCGYKNDASVDICEKCGKDISWIKVPEQTPIIDTPVEKPRPLPKGQPVFTLKAIIVAILIILMLVGLVVAMVLFGRTPDKGSGADTAVIMSASLPDCPTLSTYMQAAGAVRPGALSEVPA